MREIEDSCVSFASGNEFLTLLYMAFYQYYMIMSQDFFCILGFRVMKYTHVTELCGFS